MRRLLIISGIALLVSIARMLRRSGPQEQEQSRPLEREERDSDSLSQENAQDSAQRGLNSILAWFNLKLIAAIAISALGAGVAIEAFNRFEYSASLAPVEPPNMEARVYSPIEDPQVGFKIDPFTKEPDKIVIPGPEPKFPRRDEVRTLGYAQISVWFTPETRSRDCRIVYLRLSGGLKSRDGEYKQYGATLLKYQIVKFPGTLVRLKVCPRRGSRWLMGSLIWQPSVPNISVAAHRAIVKVPATASGMPHGWNKFSDAAEAEIGGGPEVSEFDGITMGGGKHVATLAELPAQTKTETLSSSPEMNYRQHEWNGDGGTLDEMVTLIYAPAEAAANRDLFIAGAAIGLAGGLIPYAIEMTIAGVPRRRRTDNGELQSQ